MTNMSVNSDGRILIQLYSTNMCVNSDGRILIHLYAANCVRSHIKGRMKPCQFLTQPPARFQTSHLQLTSQK